MPAVRFSVAFSAAILIGALVPGCAAFKGKQRLDFGPFAENTIGMVGEMQKFNRPPIWTHLKQYQALPSVLAAQRAGYPTRDLLRGVAFYSAHLVSVQESSLHEDEKVREIARYLDEALRPTLASTDSGALALTTADLDRVLTDVRHSKTLLESLRAAQPIVSATTAYGNDLFDQLELAIQKAGQDVNARIEQEYAPVKNRIAELDELRLDESRCYVLLQEYRSGNAAALDSMMVRDPSLRELVPAGKRPTGKDLDALDQHLIDRLDIYNTMRDQLTPDFEEYRACQAELDMLRNQSDERARIGRMALTLWSRSHRNLAAGIAVAPMIDVAGMLKSAASKGAGAVIP